MTDFSTLTACGECCTGCEKKLDRRCPGCIESDGRVPEWAESGRCRIHACVKAHNTLFCGLCDEFPCARVPSLISWNPDIVEHLSSLRDEYRTTHPLQIRLCTPENVPELAVMNKALIMDERSLNPMTTEELRERMLGFIRGEYAAYLFLLDQETIGYALVKNTSSPLYLRQFYIKDAFRRRHYGKQAFRKLMEHLRADTIDIDVLPWNDAGRAFWKSCGFEETCVSMHFCGIQNKR